MELSEEIRREAELVYDAELSGGDYRPPAHLLQYFADEVADLEEQNANMRRIVDGIQKFMRSQPEGADHY